MNEQQTGNLDALVQEKLTADTEFQSSLEGLNEEEVAEATAKREGELRNEIFASTYEYGKNQKIRAEKAEKGDAPDGDGKPPKKAPKKDDDKDDDDGEHKFSIKDSYALQQNEVHLDDLDKVVETAKMLGTDIAGALENDVLQGILKQRSEERASAAAANTGGGAPSTHKPTGSELNKNLSEGKVPEPGSEEAEELFWARRGGRRS